MVLMVKQCEIHILDGQIHILELQIPFLGTISPCDAFRKKKRAIPGFHGIFHGIFHEISQPALGYPHWISDSSVPRRADNEAHELTVPSIESSRRCESGKIIQG